jgi:hypothetical protein
MRRVNVERAWQSEIYWQKRDNTLYFGANDEKIDLPP